MAITFPGTSGNGLTVTSTFAPANFTVLAFVRARTGSTGVRCIWHWKNAGGEEYSLALDATHKLVCYHNGSDRAQSAAALTLGSEYYVVLGVTGSTITISYALTSTNAALIASTGTRTAAAGASGATMVGESQRGEYWDGEIQSMRIWETVLGTNDLASEQKRQILRRWDAWSWYRLLDNDTSGDKYWDRSGNGRDLSEIGAGSGRSTGLNVGPGYNPRTARRWRVQATVDGTAAFTTPACTIASAGTPVVTGTAAITTTFSAAAAGTPVGAGAAGATTSVSVAASGSPVVAGDAVVSTTFIAAADGTPVVDGTGSLAPSASVAAAGAPVVTGAAAFATGFDVDEVGSPVVEGPAAGTTQVPSVSASGSPVVAGSAAVSTTFVVEMEGSVGFEGAAFTTPMPTIEASGTPVVLGTISITPMPMVLIRGPFQSAPRGHTRSDVETTGRTRAVIDDNRTKAERS